MYTKTGKIAQQFDFGREPNEKEFSTMTCSPSGQALVVGSYDR